MERRAAFCSACDRNVPVLVEISAWEKDSSARRVEDAVVCLDYGVRCTGALCPMFGVPEVPWEEIAARRVAPARPYMP